jgi:hypothetical protein
MGEIPDYDSAAIEAEFVASWEKMEHYYLRHDTPTTNWIPALRLFFESREGGYDRDLRALHSHNRLILTRSGDNVFVWQIAKPYIIFDWDLDSRLFITYYDQDKGDETLYIEKEILTPDIEALLVRLIAEPIY